MCLGLETELSGLGVEEGVGFADDRPAIPLFSFASACTSFQQKESEIRVSTEKKVDIGDNVCRGKEDVEDAKNNRNKKRNALGQAKITLV